MRYFAHLAYNGSAYSGWQRQANTLGIQQVIEDALSRFLKQRIVIFGCGRTDALVHASQYFIHFDVPSNLPANSIDIINRMLPPDISIFEFIEMNPGAHAQFDASERTYSYFAHFSHNPYIGRLSAFYNYKTLDIQLMQKATRILLKYTDYSGLCKTPDKHSITESIISDVQLYTNPGKGALRLEISANRFLRGMIRIIMGKLFEIGTGKLSLEQFEEGIANKQTPRFLNLAYPQGLYLSKITYPYLNLPANNTLLPHFEKREWQKVIV